MVESSSNASNSAGQLYKVPPECNVSSIHVTLPLVYYSDSVLTNHFLFKPFENIIITVIFPIVFILGFVGNIAFLFVIARVKEMRTLTNFYLANLAVADLLNIILQAIRNCGTYAYYGIRNAEFFKTDIECIIGYGTILTTFYASLLLVTLVSFERFMAICYPLKHRTVNTTKRTVTLIIFSWLIAMGMAAVVVPGWGSASRVCLIWPTEREGGERWKGYPYIRNTCLPVKKVYEEIRILVQFIPYIVTLTINIVFYAKIIFRLSNRVVPRLKNEEKKDKSDTDKVRNQVARMLITNGVVFFICLTPFQFRNLDDFIFTKTGKSIVDSGDINKYQAMLWSSRTLVAFNSAINPYLYNMSNARYRKSFWKAIGRRETVKKNKPATPLPPVSRDNNI